MAQTYQGALSLLGVQELDPYTTIYEQYQVMVTNLNHILEIQAEENDDGAISHQTKQLIRNLKTAIDTVFMHRKEHGYEEDKT